MSWTPVPLTVGAGFLPSKKKDIHSSTGWEGRKGGNTQGSGHHLSAWLRCYVILFSLYDLPEQLLTHGVPFSSSAGKGSDKYLRRMTSSHSLSRHSALGRFINRKHDVHITAFWGMYIQVWVSPTALSVPGAIFCSFS